MKFKLFTLLLCSFIISSVVGVSISNADSIENFAKNNSTKDDIVNGHQDKCGKYSPSWHDHQDVRKEFRLKYIKGSAYDRLARGLVKDTIDDGFIIGVEKHSRFKIDGFDKPHEDYLGTFKRYGNNRDVQRNNWLNAAFSNPTALHVSHIFQYTNRNSCSILSDHTESQMCNSKTNTNARSFHGGISALESRLLPALRQKIEEGNFSHILFMAMGWHNNQRVSICRYDQVSKYIKQGYGKEFKPLIVGFTWPSAWFAESNFKPIDFIGHIASIFNKATDSDELGYLIGNIVLNHIIPAANTKKLPVIAIGHSMGARVVGRSIFTRDLLIKEPLGDGPDLFVALQPAHSVHRFVPNSGLEGDPYAPIPGLRTRVVATSSKHDKANPLAIWTKYLGGKTGLKAAYKINDPSVFNIVEGLMPAKRVKLSSQVPVIVNAFDFIYDHNDIMNAKVGELIAALIKRSTK